MHCGHKGKGRHAGIKFRKAVSTKVATEDTEGYITLDKSTSYTHTHTGIFYLNPYKIRWLNFWDAYYQHRVRNIRKVLLVGRWDDNNR